MEPVTPRRANESRRGERACPHDRKAAPPVQPSWIRRSEFQTRVKLSAWVKNIAYAKNVWFDAHVFDGGNQLVHAQTLSLHYKGGAGGGGDLFEFDDVLYHGSRGQPGSVSPRPDARRVQLRLYFEASGQLFTDGIFHGRQSVEDGAVH